MIICKEMSFLVPLDQNPITCKTVNILNPNMIKTIYYNINEFAFIMSLPKTVDDFNERSLLAKSIHFPI